LPYLVSCSCVTTRHQTQNPRLKMMSSTLDLCGKPKMVLSLQSIKTLRRYYQSVAQSGKLTPALAPGAGGGNQCHRYRNRSDSIGIRDRHPAYGHFCQRCQSYGKNARGGYIDRLRKNPCAKSLRKGSAILCKCIHGGGYYSPSQ
jgi:hypothetical protein